MEQKKSHIQEDYELHLQDGKKDLNYPKKVHTKHKIRRHFWKPREQKLSVGIKKTHQNACQKKEESKMRSWKLFRKSWKVFSSPILLRYVY